MLKFKRADGKIKEKVVFKFQFHVTRVPQTGWEKLKVSLIPQDTGKRSNKTGKALVEYGCCRWPDPIVESTKLSQDALSGRYEDKFYKIIVGTRSKVLGDVIINLADFANAASNPIALPLQNCRGNTLLHSKIYSLTSLKKSRELSVQDEASSNSEEEEEEGDNHSVASSTSQALSGPLPKSVSSPRQTASRYSTDTPLSPKEGNGSAREFYNADPPSPSNSVTSRRRRFSQSSFPSIPPEAQLSRASSSRLEMNELAKLENETPRSVRSLSFRSKSALELDAPVPEKTVQELRMEAVTWQRRARAMSLEVQKLKQDLGSVMRQKAGEMPLDKLKLELQSVKQEYAVSEQRLRKEVDELQRSLAYEKEAGTELNMQLRKAQDSNMQLVLAIQDMEESLEEQRREMEGLSSMNQKLEVSVYEAKVREQNLENEWLEKLASKEEIIKALEDKLESYMNSNKAGQNFKEMERELKELTEENMELIYKLSKTTRDLENKSKTVFVSPQFEGSPDHEEVDRLKSMIVELEKKLAATEEFHQLQHSSNEKLMSRLQMLMQGLKKTNGDLENQLRNSEQKVQDLSEELERERAALEEARNRSAYDEGRLNAVLLDLKSCKFELESRVSKMVAQAQEHDRNLGYMLEELESRESTIKRLEEGVLQVEMLNSGLEMKIQDSQELDNLNKLRIHELETQVSTLAEDVRVGKESGKELLSKIQILEVELVETNKMLRSEQEHSQQHVDKLLRAKLDLEKSAAVNASLEEKISRVEKTRQEVELQLGRSKDENIEMMEKLTRIEAEARFVESELENSKQQHVKTYSQVLDSEKQRVAMAAALSEYKSKWIELSAQREKDVHALRELEQQLKTMKAEASDHFATKEVLGRQVVELEESIRILETDTKKSAEILKAQVAGLKLEKEQVLKRELAIIDELNSLKKELEHQTEQKVEADHAALKLEKKISNLQASLEDSENNYSDLEVKAILLEAEYNSLKLAHDKVQEKVLLLEAEKERIDQARHELEIHVKTLTDQVASHQRSEEGLSKRVSGAEESLKTALEKLETCVREKAEVDEEVVRYWDRNKTLEADVEQAKSDCMDFRMKMETQRNRESQTRQLLEMEHEHLNGLLQEYMNSKDELQKRIKEFEEQRNRLEKLRENSSARILSLEARVAELESSIASKEQENETLVCNVDTLSAANTECALKLSHCEQQVHLLKLQNEQLLEQNIELVKLDSSEEITGSESDEQEVVMKLSDKMALVQEKLRGLRAKLEAERAKDKHEERNVEEFPPLENLLKEQREEDMLTLLEVHVTRELEALKQEYDEKEADLKNKLDYLETTIQRQMDAGLEQFQVEVTRLQKQLSFCSRRERELVSKLSTQEILEKEIRRLQQDNEQLVDTIARLKAASEWDDAHARIVVLETELNEALEASAAYKAQLEQFSLSDEAAGTVEMKSWNSWKRKSSELELELKDLQDRYSNMSVQFAEVVAEKEQLVFALRNVGKSAQTLNKRRSF